MQKNHLIIFRNLNKYSEMLVCLMEILLTLLLEY